MMQSEKYAHVNIDGAEETVLVRIKKEASLPDADKLKLSSWAERHGFTLSKRKHILRVE